MANARKSSSSMGVGGEVYVSVIAYAYELDSVWCLIQGYLLRGGMEESEPALLRLRQLLTAALVKAENRFVYELDRVEVSPKTTVSDSDVASPGPRNPPAAAAARGAAATAGQAHAYARSVGKERDAAAAVAVASAAAGGSRRSSGSGTNSASVPFLPPTPPHSSSFLPPPSSSARKKTQLDGMVGAVVLALKFLPLDAAPIALIVTDGVADYPSPMDYDGLSMRLCRYDVAISCLLVDHDSYAAARKHRVPDLNGLAHLVGVTGGFFYDLETL
ncbi:unnamed protein product, partial [Laminaria digitata]